MKATKYLFGWHHYCGLIVGLFLLLMSSTGTLLVFSEELEGLENRSIPAVQAMSGKPSFDASFQSVQNKYPGWEIRLYHLPQADKTLVYELRQQEKRKKVYVHPVSGAILGSNENANQSLQRRLLLLHYTLFAGTTGKVIIFVVGVLFLITLITGLVVYRKSLLKAFTFRIRFNRKTTRAFYSSLHRIVGVWSLLFNLLLVSSGLVLSGQIALTALKAPTKAAAKKEVPPIQSVDAVVAMVNAAYPQFEMHQVRIRPGGNAVQVSGRLTSDPSYYGLYYSGFMVNGSTLEIEKSTFMKDMPVTDRLMKMSGPLHFGNYGGLLLKILYSLLGFTPAILSISGFVLWRKRNKVKTTNKSQQALLKKTTATELS